MNLNDSVGTKAEAISPKYTCPLSVVNFITGAPGFRLKLLNDTQNVSGRVDESK